MIGIGWEVIETLLGQNKLTISGHRIQLIGDQDDDGNCTNDSDAYWYGKESDIIMNMSGYLIGDQMAKKWL